LFIGIFTDAQSLYKVDNDGIDKIVLTQSYGRQLHVVSVNDNREYGIQKWNGVEWSDFEVVDGLPKQGSNPDGEFVLTGLFVKANGYFLCGHYTINTSGEDLNIVVSNEGGTWKDISDNAIRQSTALHGFVEWENDVYLIGTYRLGRNTNLLKWSGSSWTPTGDLLTKDLNKDFVSDFSVIGNKIQAVGKFTVSDKQSTYAIAEFDNGIWKPVSKPAFVGEAYRFGTWKGQTVFIGKPHLTNDYVKLDNDGNWTSLESGFDNIEAIELGNIQELGNDLYLSGQFKNKSDASLHSVIRYHNNNWGFLEWGLDQKDLLLDRTSEELFIYGDFNHRDLKNIAKISEGDALISGTIFNDLNSDCVQQSNETGLAFIPFEIYPGGHRFITDYQGNFQVPVAKGDYTIKLISDPLYNQTCSKDINITVDENRRYLNNGLGMLKKANTLDLDVELVSSKGWVIGANVSSEIRLCIKNNGTIEASNGKLRIEIPEWLKVSWSVTPNSDSEGDYWDIGNLKPDSSLCFSAFATSGNAPDGEIGSIEYELQGISPMDVNGWNNAGEVIFTAGSSQEPIFKQLAEKTISTRTEKLHYHIGAQNVSGKEQGNIWIRDTLDEELYIMHVREYASFPSTLKQDYIPLSNGNYQYIFTWIADENFVLQDSGVNSDESSAFVQFELQLADGFMDGDETICNQAEIFFENLEPLLTNEICNEVQNIGTGKRTEISNVFTVYPIPTSGKLQIINPTLERTTFTVLDLQGKIVHEPFDVLPKSTGLIKLDVVPGVYFLHTEGYSALRILVIQ